MTDSPNTGHADCPPPPLRSEEVPPKPCVVVPTYNNAETIESVVRSILPIIGHVLVVDDGSTDETPRILEKIEGITVLRHEGNRGKGVALSDAFARATDMGFTHAITMDADGQHLASDLPTFLAAVDQHPEAFILGKRDLRGRERGRRKSRLMRFNSNFWVWIETGKWLPDTQSGFRAYPLAATQTMLFKTRKYDFEIETLVKCMWAGAAAVHVPVAVRYGTGSKSHFRPLRDFALVAHLNACLVGQSLVLPAFLRREMHKKAFRSGPIRRTCSRLLRDALKRECRTPAAFAAAIGIGLFFGIAPVWGFQMALAYLAANQLGLNKLVAVAASNISLPVMIPFILYASVVLGRFILTGQTAPADVSAVRYGIEYLVGSVVLAAGAGVAGAAVSYVLVRSVGLIWGRG